MIKLVIKMTKPTSKLIIVDSGKPMKVALGSLYVLNKPISAYECGAQLLTKDYEILVAMFVGFSEIEKMLFYVIAIRKSSFLKRLEEISYRMLNDTSKSAPIILNMLTNLVGTLIRNILKAINYYLRESEVICGLRVIKSDILGAIRQNLDLHKKPRKSKLVELAKNDIDKIIKAMLTNKVANINIKRNRLSLFESTIWCENHDMRKMKWHEVGRIVDIKQWPIEAIRLWAKYQLCIPHRSFINAFIGLATDETKEALIESIQKYNASRIPILEPKNLWSEDLLSNATTTVGRLSVEPTQGNESCSNSGEYSNDALDEEFYRTGFSGR